MFLFVGMFLMGSVSGLECWWDEAQQYSNIQLQQRCPSCSYVNITSITYPNGTVFLNELMQQNGTNFNYSLPDSSQIGKVIYSVIGDKNSASPPQEQTLCIEIESPSAGQGLNIFIILILCSFLTLVFAVLFKVDWMAFFAGILFIITGVYTMVYGIGPLNDMYTRSIAGVALGIGIIVMIVSGYESLEGEGEY